MTTYGATAHMWNEFCLSQFPKGGSGLSCQTPPTEVQHLHYLFIDLRDWSEFDQFIWELHNSIAIVLSRSRYR